VSSCLLVVREIPLLAVRGHAHLTSLSYTDGLNDTVALKQADVAVASEYIVCDVMLRGLTISVTLLTSVTRFSGHPRLC
jgi:hypothetical protein